MLLRRGFVQLAFALLPACALAQPSSPAKPVDGGTLTYVSDIEPPALVSLLDPNTRIRNISAKITEGLLRYDAQFQPQPLLATRWSVSPDGLRYTFELRRGVKWHDGKEFTAADVRYAVLTQKTHGPRGRITLANLDRVETPDAHTAVLVLSKPAPYLLKALSSAELPIVPAHRYGEGDPLASANATAPVGTGPFIFEQWVRGSHVILRKNPNYWRTGTPHLDRIIFRFIPDAAAIAATLEAGEVDVATNVNLTDLDRLSKNSALRIEDSYDAYLNNAVFLEYNLDNPVLAKREVRHAIAHAIDRKALASVVWNRRSEVVNSPVPKVFANYHDDTGFRYPPDAARANQLLDQAGYPRQSNGTRFSLKAINIPGASFKKSAEFLRASLARVGIRLDLLDGDLPTYIKRAYTAREFDLNINGLGRLYDPTVGVQRLYWGGAVKNPIIWTNAAHYENATVDDLFRQAATEVDERRRGAYFREVQQIVGRDLPVYPLVTVPSAVQVYNARVHGLVNSIDLTAGDLSDAWLQPRR